MRVQTLERMRRLFILVLLAAQFVAYIQRTWSAQHTTWLRLLGGALDLPQDRNGLYLLLHGIAAIWNTVAVLTFALLHPFQTISKTYG